MPPAEVDVITVASASAVISQDLPGRVQAVRSAQVRARIEGVLEKRLFTEGTDIAAGTPLFRIDSRSYQAQAAAAAADLAAAQGSLRDLQERAANGEAPTGAPQSASERHYQAFQEVLAEESQVLASIQAVLDLVASHQLLSTRAEYQRGRDLQAQADTLQMIVPVRGRYADIRRWIEEILATQPFVAVDELGFKRDEIARNEVEARVRLSIWHHPARPAEGVGALAADATERADEVNR